MRRQWLGYGLVLVFLACFNAGCVREHTGNNPMAQPPGRSSTLTQTTKPVEMDRPDVVAAKPIWFACRKDADCMVAKGPCGQSQAVNVNFLTDFADFSQRMGRMIACESGPAQKEAKPTLQCLKTRCSIAP